jgi:parallel beta-helix repeat protein
MAAGDTLFIRGGTYDEWLQDVGSGLTLSAYQQETVILKPQSNGPIDVIYFQEGSNQSSVVFNGLILDAEHVLAHGFEIRADETPNPSHHIKLVNCEIKNAVGNGVAVGRLSHHNEFINCKVHDNGNDLFAHGFYMNSNDSVIDGCEVYGHVGWGLHLYSQPHQNMVIKNCHVHNNNEGGILIYNATNDLAYNNVVRANGGWGGIKAEYCANAKILNNTAYGNDGDGILVKESSDTTVRNNIAYLNGVLDIHDDNSTSTVQDHNLSADPLFVDVSTGDLRLQAGSPAINAGATLTELTTDKDGVVRPQGSSYDIGAYEFSNGGSMATVSCPLTFGDKTVAVGTVVDRYRISLLDSNGVELQGIDVPLNTPSVSFPNVAPGNGYRVRGRTLDGGDNVLDESLSAAFNVTASTTVIKVVVVGTPALG